MEKHAERKEAKLSSTENTENDYCSRGTEKIIYEIHVRGQLDGNWSEFFDGMQVKLLKNGEMILFGPIIDQAALIGVLNKLGHLNLAVISFGEVKTKT